MANVSRGKNSLFKTWLHLLLGDEILYRDITKLYKNSVPVCYISYLFPIFRVGDYKVLMAKSLCVEIMR